MTKLDIADLDAALVDEKTGKLRVQSLNMRDLLFLQINRILSISSGLHTAENLNQYGTAVTVFGDCLLNAESICGGHIDKQYFREKEAIIKAPFMAFEEKEKEWIATLHIHDTLDKEKFSRRKYQYELDYRAEQLRKQFACFMSWIRRANLGFDLKEVKA